MLIKPGHRHWERLRTAATECLRAGPAGATPGHDGVTDLCSAAEYLVTEAFGLEPLTRGYWLDGVDPTSVNLPPDGPLLVRADAWCAERSQWLVPCEVEVTFGSNGPDRCLVRLGDAALANLAAHRNRSSREPPAAWLHTFEFAPVRPDPGSLERCLSQLRAWLAAHPDAPTLVGQDWGYLTPTEAEAFVRNRIAAGQHVAVEETWLDGRDALRLRDER